MGYHNSEEADEDWVETLLHWIFTKKLNVVEFGMELKAYINEYGCTDAQVKILADVLFRNGIASWCPDMRVLECLESLVHSEDKNRNQIFRFVQDTQKCSQIIKTRSILDCKWQKFFLNKNVHVIARRLSVLDWSVYLEMISKFCHFERVLCVRVLTTLLCKAIPAMKCTYTFEMECLDLASAITSAFKWCFLALDFSLKNKSGDTVPTLINCIHTFTGSTFVRAMIYLHEIIDSNTDVARYVKVTALSFAQLYPENNDLCMLYETLKSIGFPPISDAVVPGCPSILQQHPAVFTLVTVFEGFRMSKTVEEMADIFVDFSQILEIPYAVVFRDMIRASLLILVDQTFIEELEVAEAFFYFKTPRILKLLLELGAPRQELLDALSFVSKSKTLLDKVDIKTATTSFHYFMQQLVKESVINNDTMNNLIARRVSSCKDRHSAGASTAVHEPVILRANVAKAAVDKMFRQANFGFHAVLTRLVGGGASGTLTFDSVCASFCSDGDLTYFSSKLAQINAQHERIYDSLTDESRRYRSVIFNLSFIFLSRIRFIYRDIHLVELVNGSDRNVNNTDSAFYSFSAVYGWTAVDCHMPYESRILDTVEVERFRNFLTRKRFMEEAPHVLDLPWKLPDVDYAEVIAAVPYIGNFLFEQAKILGNDDFLNLLEMVVRTFREDMEFMIICLIQWLCSLSLTDARQRLVHTFLLILKQEESEKMERKQEKKDRKEWSMLYLTICQRTLADLLLWGHLQDPPTTTLISYAKHKLPAVPYTLPPLKTQAFETNILAQAFIFARQEGWCSPNVLQLIDRCVKSSAVENWCVVWLNDMLRLSTNDEMIMAGELCLAASVLSPVTCMLSFARNVTDYVLEQNLDFGCVEPKALFSAKFLLQSLQLSYMTVHREKNGSESNLKRAEAEKRLKASSSHSSSDYGRMGGQNLVESALEVIFDKFLRETRNGHLKSTITFIFHFMISLASAHPNEATRRICGLIPHELLENLARLDPQTFTLDVYFPLVALDTVESAKQALMFTCLLRKFGGL